MASTGYSNDETTERLKHLGHLAIHLAHWNRHQLIDYQGYGSTLFRFQLSCLLMAPSDSF